MKAHRKIIFRLAIAYGKIITRLHVFLSRIKLYCLFPTISRSSHTTLDWRTSLRYPGNIEIGKRCIIGAGVSIGAMSKVTIGDLVRISANVFIETATLNFPNPLPYKHKSSPITIEEGVWLCANSTVIGGVTIGKYSVITPGSVVRENIPPYSIVFPSNFEIHESKKLKAYFEQAAQNSDIGTIDKTHP